MAAQQIVLFTILPRGISIDRDALPVSVVVSPRLGGGTKLGAFPDWLNWTPSLKQNGLTLSIRCANRSRDVDINSNGLRPDLWRALFNEETLVDPFQFPNYPERGIISYSVRQTLSALKSVYQQASVTLALPAAGDLREQKGNRGALRNLVEGLGVPWNGDSARSWRREVRAMNRHGSFAALEFTYANRLDREGLLVGDPEPSMLQRVAVPFAVFHHMPTPERKGKPPVLDKESVLDFHRVLSSLNSYPELQRALGLVFDLELPADFVHETAAGKFGTFSVKRAHFGWQLETQTPELPTAYVHVEAGTHRLFFTAPRRMDDATAPSTIIGLLDLDPNRFGLAQVDVDGGMHKAMILAETVNSTDPARNLDRYAQPDAALHPEVFDPEATLPSLRSGGFSLFADQRGLELLDSLTRSRGFNDAVITNGADAPPFFAEDLLRGYRLDVWDSHTGAWHSLHLRNGIYQIGEENFTTENEEGFVQLAITQPAPGAVSSDPHATTDLYIHEAIARWAGWSLSAPRPGKHLSRFADPSKAVPPDGDDPDYAENQPDTPFKMTANYSVAPGTLPRLRFGTRYRIRARVVDLAGNSMRPDDTLADALAPIFALPRDAEGFTYLRYEPVAAPLIVLRDPEAVKGPGSAIDRIVIRTRNDEISKDAIAAADTTANDRHIVPPRTSVEMGERLGIFDDASGKLKSDPATWQLISKRDAGEFNQVEIQIAGKIQDPENPDKYPVEPGERIDALPYLPDSLSRGAVFRDLPGTPSAAIGSVVPNGGAAASVNYELLSDANPRPGSATMISFGENADWEETVGFRFALEEPKTDQADVRPLWDPVAHLLTVFLSKGETTVVPLSSFVSSDDLKLMGVWQWLREYVERITIANPQQQYLRPGFPVDQIAHVLQRAVEGGHWMLTPPRLITLVHAVQQPIGQPAFSALRIEHTDPVWDKSPPLQTEASAGRTDPTELAPITAWRKFGGTDAFLIGALRLHGASTAKVDLVASWDEPIDDITQETWTTSRHTAHADELPLPNVVEGYLVAPGADERQVGYYDPEHNQICFVRAGDWIGTPNRNQRFLSTAAPRHLFNDTKHRRVTYSAVTTSRYREYFAKDLDFTRASEPVVVDVPASARPLAARVAYVLPTFGWERQTATNLKRSVRFGGGLRVYLHRSWFSSGEGELLGVALWSYENGALDAKKRDKFKPFFTQWGMDPIWQTENLSGAPAPYSFADATSTDFAVSLEERSANDPATGQPGRVDVVGFPVQFDPERKLWFSDLTINMPTETYMPFVRLALVRYQPHALGDAKISRVVLADFAQLTPDRSAMVTSDPHHPKTIRVVVSGVAPRGPQPVYPHRAVDTGPRSTEIRVRVQEQDEAFQNDLVWHDVPETVAKINPGFDDFAPGQPSLAMWAGSITFTQLPEVGRYRLLIEEFEYVSATAYTMGEDRAGRLPARLIYAETFDLDDALISET